MSNNKPTVSIITLGCRANQYESSAITRELEDNGFEVVPADRESDLCIINTCTVTAESDRKSKQMIRRAASKAKHVIVTGCFSEVSPNTAAAIEGVDVVVSNKIKSKVVDAAKSLTTNNTFELPTADLFESCDYINRLRSERVRAYLKIEDGCDNNCAYCIIPKARGPVRSKSPELIIDEAKTCVANGIKELILTGIEIAKYGMDLTEDLGLIDIVEQITNSTGIERISLGSLDPKYLTLENIKRFASITAFTRHFHLSLQSGCSNTLKAMRRKYNAEQIRNIVSDIYSVIPDAMISVDAIAGFPGESEEDFAESVKLLREIRPLHIHSFPYSRREGTEAASLKEQIPEADKKRRNRTLCDLSKSINRSLLTQYALSHKDDPVKVLCESVSNGVGVGHSEHYVEVAFPAYENDVGKMLKISTSGVSENRKENYVNGVIV